MQRNQNRKHRRAWLGCIPMVIVVALCCASIMVGLGAKYIQQFDSGYKQADAQYFYLSSDRLTPEGAGFTHHCAKLSEAIIPVELRNYRDTLNFSEMDYDVTLSYHLDGETEYKDLQSLTLKGGAANKEILNISLGDIIEKTGFKGDNLKLYIQAQVAAPYKATLVGYFDIVQDYSKTVNYQVKDSKESNIVTLYVTTHDVGGTVTVTPPTGCLADPTSHHLQNLTINSRNQAVTFDFAPDSEYTFVFFKTDPSQVYGQDNFTFQFS